MTIHLFWFTEPSENKYGSYQFSNQEIQKNFLLEFSKYGDVAWHHSNARGRVTSNPDDILVGHVPWPPVPTAHQHDNWMFDNGLAGPGSMHPNTFLVMPWAGAVTRHPSTDPFVEAFLGCRGLFGMGGLHHYDKNLVSAAPDTLWRRTQKQLVRINMGCDAKLLAHKQEAHGRAPGLLHVSSLMGYKRPELMLRSLPDAGCTLYIGTKRFDMVEKLAQQGLMKPNVKVIGEVSNDKPEHNAFILENCSYYFHCAREPQATTILENGARGLVPIITARSGFSCPDAIYLSDDDHAENQRIVANALAMSNEEYAARSRAVRMHVRMYHSWDRICCEMYIAMRALIAGQDVPRRGDEYS